VVEGKGYTLQVLTTGGGKGYTLQVLTTGNGRKGIHPASSHNWWWKGIHPARSHCWWCAWILPVRSDCPTSSQSSTRNEKNAHVGTNPAPQCTSTRQTCQIRNVDAGGNSNIVDAPLYFCLKPLTQSGYTLSPKLTLRCTVLIRMRPEGTMSY
jgi:hypothetical protein